MRKLRAYLGLGLVILVTNHIAHRGSRGRSKP